MCSFKDGKLKCELDLSLTSEFGELSLEETSITALSSAAAVVSAGVSARGSIGSRGCVASAASIPCRCQCGSGLLGRWWRRRIPVRIGWRRGLHEKLPIDKAENEEADDPHGNHGLEVLQPELVLHGRGLLLKLGAPVLQGVGALFQSSQFSVALKPRINNIDL